MAIFHSYVSLPEGKSISFYIHVLLSISFVGHQVATWLPTGRQALFAKQHKNFTSNLTKDWLRAARHFLGIFQWFAWNVAPTVEPEKLVGTSNLGTPGTGHGLIWNHGWFRRWWNHNWNQRIVFDIVCVFFLNNGDGMNEIFMDWWDIRGITKNHDISWTYQDWIHSGGSHHRK